MYLETISETQARLTRHGFVDDLIADHGQLRSAGSNKRHDLDAVIAAEIVRYEGDSDPGDEAILIAVSTTDGEPIGTFTAPYGPQATREQTDVLVRLHGPVVQIDDSGHHGDHDHIAAVFADRQAATAAVVDLRSTGLGSEHLGLAVHDNDHVVFERGEETDIAQAAAGGATAGATLGYLAGFALFAALAPGVGIGGIAVLAASGIVGGGVLGGYLGISTETDEFNEHHEISRTALEQGEVLIIACGHQEPDLVRSALQRHGGRLITAD